MRTEHASLASRRERTFGIDWVSERLVRHGLVAVRREERVGWRRVSMHEGVIVSHQG